MQSHDGGAALTADQRVDWATRTDLEAEVLELRMSRDQLGQVLRRALTEIDHRRTQIDDVRARNGELLEELRSIKKRFAPFAALEYGISEGRCKHPAGVPFEALVEEVGEVARALMDEPHRVRDELLDVAVCAMRMWLGETVAAAASLLPGWTCLCGVFNGDAKVRRVQCRSCDLPRPYQPAEVQP